MLPKAWVLCLSVLIAAPAFAQTLEERVDTLETQMLEVQELLGIAPPPEPDPDPPPPVSGHVVPGDVGVTIGVGVIAPVPTEFHTASKTISVANTVIENQIINGCLRVRADGLVLRNVIVNCGGHYPVYYYEGYSNATIEYSHINCTSTSKAIRIRGYQNVTISKSEIQGCDDWIYGQKNIDGLVIEDTYFHSVLGGSGSHADGFQIGQTEGASGTIQVRRSYFDMNNPGGSATALVYLTGGYSGSFAFEGNYLHPMGGATLRVYGAADFFIRNNVFDDAFWYADQDGDGSDDIIVLNEGSGTFEFKCNVYASGGFVEEHLGSLDRVVGGDHVTTGC